MESDVVFYASRRAYKSSTSRGKCCQHWYVSPILLHWNSRLFSTWFLALPIDIDVYISGKASLTTFIKCKKHIDMTMYGYTMYSIAPGLYGQSEYIFLIHDLLIDRSSGHGSKKCTWPQYNPGVIKCIVHPYISICFWCRQPSVIQNIVIGHQVCPTFSYRDWNSLSLMCRMPQKFWENEVWLYCSFPEIRERFPY